MNKLSQDAQRLIDAARSDLPSGDVRARIRAGIETELAKPAPDVDSTNQPEVSATSPNKLLGKILPVTLVAGFALLAASLLLPSEDLQTQAPTPERTPSKTPPRNVTPAPVPPNSEGSRQEPQNVPKEDTAAHPRPKKKLHKKRPVVIDKPTITAPPSTPSNTNQLAEELKLLSSAKIELKNGRTEQALENLKVHESRYAKGILAEERELLKILVLCRQGKTNEAVNVARILLKAHPNSPARDKIEATCVKKAVLLKPDGK